MSQKRKKPRDRQSNLADRYRAGEFAADRVFEEDEASAEHFSARSKHAQENKTAKTTLTRSEGAGNIADMETLALGQVTQVYSRFCEAEVAGEIYLCVVRKTLTKTSASQLVVGDHVRIRSGGTKDEQGRTEAVIEQILPRKTILTRADSFKATTQQPIVANADQMLIVASVKNPAVKWGLVDRMIVAAKSGGLVPIVCLNKIDLINSSAIVADDLPEDESMNPLAALDHYLSIGIQTLQTSIDPPAGLDELRESLANRVTVLSGHSGVGKSSLIRSIQPKLDIRVGEVSEYTAKGRHTTTSARRYLLDFGGTVVDTPGVKLFGIWNVSRERLIEFFPDVEAETAPLWRQQSYKRILNSLPREKS